VKRFFSIQLCITAALMVGCADAMLTQAELNDVSKLVSQHQSASASAVMKREAADWMRSAAASAKERRCDRASNMYGEAALRFPSLPFMR
jgi:hypothetical protein